MPLFGLGDITFKSITSAVTGPLAPLNSSSFFGSNLRYPIDVGNYDKGHYMVIYIREQKESSYGQNLGIPDSSLNSASAPTSASIGQSVLGTLAGSEVINKFSTSAAKNLGSVGQTVTQYDPTAPFKYPTQMLGGNGATTDNILSKNILGSVESNGVTNSFGRITQLTKDTIALYMPDTLLFQHEQMYNNEVTLGDNLPGQLLGGLRSYADAYKKTGNKQDANAAAIKSGVMYGINRAAGKAGAAGQVAFTRLTGAVVNPMLELIYTSPKFRTFQFDFTFYPRSETEALEVQKIIEKLRFHQAPEFYQETVGFLKPPSEFDIRFYYGGSINPNIPPLITCVLENIQINYAPNGFSAYESEGDSGSLGGTGMPVAIQLSLSFRETSYLTKSDFRQDNGWTVG